MAAQNALATTLRQLHVPGKPLLLTNVYDAVSAKAVAALPGTRALATASYAVAPAAGVTDDAMTLETNLNAVRSISPVAKEYGLPLSVDWQDGYGDRLEEGVEKLLRLGVVGINLEDCDKATQKMLPINEAAERVKESLPLRKITGSEISSSMPAPIRSFMEVPFLTQSSEGNHTLLLVRLLCSSGEDLFAAELRRLGLWS